MTEKNIEPEVIEESVAEEVPATEPVIEEVAVEEATPVEPEPTPAVVEEPVVIPAPPKSKYKVPVAVNIEEVYESLPVPATPFVVSGGTVDDVLLSAIVYKNIYAKKSLSVHHLQRRLNELGYTTAYQDKDGWFGDGTRSAIDQFREDKGITASGLIDGATLEAIFDGDATVVVRVDQ